MAPHDHEDETRENREHRENGTAASGPASPNPAGAERVLKRNTLFAATGAATVAMLAAVIWLPATPDESEPILADSDYGQVPDFAAIDHIPERKAAFFAFLEPMIEDQNNWILENRAFLEALREDLMAGRRPSAPEQERVEALATRYGVEIGNDVSVEVIDELLHRGDVIPPSLILAQAAKESGWGMSRFARDGNNYFGEWCYTEGCGIVPARRGPEQNHEVEAFETVEDGLDSYFRNLNRGGPYQEVRALRAESRELGRPLSSVRLAGGLQKYSERGQVYVDEVRSLISYNKLVAFDTELVSVTAQADTEESS